jgi:hypothetical protein
MTPCDIVTDSVKYGVMKPRHSIAGNMQQPKSGNKSVAIKQWHTTNSMLAALSNDLNTGVWGGSPS